MAANAQEWTLQLWIIMSLKSVHVVLGLQGELKIDTLLISSPPEENLPSNEVGCTGYQYSGRVLPLASLLSCQGQIEFQPSQRFI